MSNINIPTQVSPFVNRSQFPALGKIRVIYIDQTENVAYYWNNTSNAYVELGAAVAVNWGDITGTLADQTDLQNALNDLVPYSGATGSVDLGANDLSVQKVFLYDEVNDNFGSIHYADGNFHIEDADGHKLFVVEDGFLQLHLTDTIQSNLFLTLLTQTRDHYLPNQSGTIALTSDITGINSGTNTGDQDLSGLTPKTRTISTTAPLTGGGDLTADRTLSIPQATTAIDGYLSAADWTIFNGKQNALGFTPVPDSRTLTINGTTQDLSADRTFTVSTGITIGTTGITSGTVGRVLFEGTGNVVQESANLFWDNTNGRLGIGGTPSNTLDVNGTFRVYHPTFGNYFDVTSTLTTLNRNVGTAQAMRGFSVTPTSGTQAFGTSTNFGTMSVGDGTNFAVLGYNWTGTGAKAVFAGITSAGNQLPIALYGRKFELYNQNNVAMTMFDTTGNFVIQTGGTHTDAGFKLDVNGTARVSGNTTISGNLLVNNTTDFGYRMDVNGNVRLSGNQNTLTGSVLIGTTYSFAASAVLKIDSTTQGFLPPRMTTTQKNAIASPATGLMVYDTTLNLISVYNGTIWISL
jgi:hypothetical protein